ncbi:MAG: sulfite reductase subunit C [Proteobacteria bacterium]|nr:sulfite reductase subunit C [Pseudomonadota bacterium]MBU4034916.1 sulfite reductase subunit C [Pseudomonadota bacterium]
MTLDVNTKAVVKNAYRITKHRGKTALRIRIPGGYLKAKHFDLLKEIAEVYGDGIVHLTTRQGFEISGIDYSSIPKVNSLINPLLQDLEIDIGVIIKDTSNGYPSAGTRNIAACIGNRVCPFANYNTTALAQRIEKEIYPNDYHVKVALTGCPNDCIKSRMNDFGIVGMVEPQYDYQRCIGCEACVKNCKSNVTGALSLHKGKVKRDARRCIGCGECILKCPTAAWTRNPVKFYDILIMGRTGKKNPRIAEEFIQWADEDVVIKVIKNTYRFIDEHIDKTLPKEHIGYIVDRTGYQVFRDKALEDIKLNPEARIAKNIQWGGFRYSSDVFMSDKLQ